MTILILFQQILLANTPRYYKVEKDKYQGTNVMSGGGGVAEDAGDVAAASQGEHEDDPCEIQPQGEILIVLCFAISIFDLVFRAVCHRFLFKLPGFPRGGSYSGPHICHVNLWGLARGCYPTRKFTPTDCFFSLQVLLHGGSSLVKHLKILCWFFCNRSRILICLMIISLQILTITIYVCFLCKFSRCIAHPTVLKILVKVSSYHWHGSQEILCLAITSTFTLLLKKLTGFSCGHFPLPKAASF